MSIAYTIAPGKGDTDLLMQGVANNLKTAGYRVCGTVQINTDICPDGQCDMDIQVLPDGPVMRISQSLGKDSRGCRLDPAALEAAVGLVEQSLENGADVVLINKFGKHEAEGRGFRPVIAQAAAEGIPVIVGLNALNKSSLIEFAGEDMTVEVAPSVDALSDWLKSASHS